MLDPHLEDPSEHGEFFEAVVIGAGFAGLGMLYQLRSRGIAARVIEAGTDVGGTWYWNRYPGARTDTEAWAYCFRLEQETLAEWEWPERYPSQPQMRSYFSWVADRLDMRKDIQFSTRVTAGSWDEDAAQWVLRTDNGQTLRCRWLISGSGLLSRPLDIPFPGLESYGGEWYSTNRWPDTEVDFTDKKVAVIGTGASGVQIIPEVAQTAEHLNVFQRTPNYVLPARNYTTSSRQRERIRRTHASLWDLVDQHVFAYPWTGVNRFFDDVASDERRQVLEYGWEVGGFQYAFKTFDDLLTNQECNDAAAEFIREKIRAIVQDAETARKLCPTNHPVFGKRPPLGHFYYETFNQPHVSLIDVESNPIVEITRSGLKTRDGTEHEADQIIFALGFDAVTGAIMDMDLTGRGGQTIQERWKYGGEAYLGIFVDGFPNLFSVYGPQSGFSNNPPTIDKQCIFIADTIAAARSTGSQTVEATTEAVRSWADTCQRQLDATILPKGKAGSWFLGTNVEGKPDTALFYFGGAPAYYDELRQCAETGFRGLAMSPASEHG